MEVHEVLAAAQRAVAEASIADDLRAVAFGKAVDLLSGTSTPQQQQVQPTPPGNGGAGAPGEASNRFDRIATKFKVNSGVVRDVYFDDGGKLGIGVNSSKLESGKSGATRQLALLVAAGRQAGGYDEEWTATKEIREVANHFGKVDDANFGKTITDMGQHFQLKGKGQNREVRVKIPGYEAAGELVAQMAGS